MSEICRRNGILLIFDEVATGFGRTGKMFACEHAAVTPDILCLAKGMTGGYLPLAATLTSEEIFSAFLGEYKEFKTFFHGHTYTGNPLGCAAAIANLELFNRENTLNKWSRELPICTALAEDFLALPHVSDVRQWGYMIGIELVQDKARRKNYPAEQTSRPQGDPRSPQPQRIIRPLGDVIILMPPLCMPEAN